MKEIIISAILVIFPIMMYLVFACYNTFLSNKKVENIIFIITMMTSLYFSLYFNETDGKLLLFCNIPVLICYFKKEELLGVILSIIVIIEGYLKFDINIYIVALKYTSYLLLYILIYKRKDFNYLFFKISAIIQGFLVSMEYFMVNDGGIGKVIILIVYVLVIYSLTFFSLYLFKIANNIKELSVMINKVDKDNKLKNSLFKLTHEIKNPIAVCKGYLDMINLDDTQKSRRYINIIKSEIDRSLNVISDFMDYSKIKINKEIFDVVMLLDEIYDSFLILANNKDIEFKYQEIDDEIYLFGDYERIKQVLVNVIKNSIESIVNCGIIDVNLEVTDKDVSIIISDNGCGMDEEGLKNIKEMFYTTKKNGTGLGVALSNEIIVSHGGSMDYDSELGKGTRCIITIPR